MLNIFHELYHYKESDTRRAVFFCARRYKIMQVFSVFWFHIIQWEPRTKHLKTIVFLPFKWSVCCEIADAAAERHYQLSTSGASHDKNWSLRLRRVINLWVETLQFSSRRRSGSVERSTQHAGRVAHYTTEMQTWSSALIEPFSLSAIILRKK